MEVTESGMEIDPRDVQPRNADSPMDVTDSPMVSDVMFSLRLNQSLTTRQFSVTDRRDLQPENAWSPMDVTDFPSVKDARDVQPANV